jgi:hypothetical protein
MKKQKSKIVDGIFYGIEVKIEDEKLIKVHNRDGTKFKDIKPQIDRIAQYLIDEGFVKDLIPMVKVIMY